MQRILSVLVFLFALIGGGCGGGADEPDAGSAADEAADAGDGGGDEQFSGEGSDDFCDKLREFSEDTATFEDDESGEKAVEALEALEAEAPAEIEDDLGLLVESIRAISEIYADGTATPTAEEQERLKKFQDPKYQAAGQRVNAYAETVCEVDVDEDGDTDGESSPPSRETTDTLEGEGTSTE